jgi:hypothetical protein
MYKATPRGKQPGAPQWNVCAGNKSLDSQIVLFFDLADQLRENSVWQAKDQ